MVTVKMFSACESQIEHLGTTALSRLRVTRCRICKKIRQVQKAGGHTGANAVLHEMRKDRSGFELCRASGDPGGW
jgi:hypothetical protein